MIGAPGPAKLLRAMRADDRGRPECGSRGNMLGVRPNVDLIVDAKGFVRGGGGGLSVTPNDVKLMPPHVRPAAAGGKGHLPVFFVSLDALGASLAFRADEAHSESHGFIEPAAPTALTEHQQHLCATKSAWSELK